MREKEYDQKMDRELNIKTTGLIEWPRGVNMDYFRTESSSYADLDRFIEEYDWMEDSRLVDFGSGKGRIVFYLNHRLGIPTTGIEINGVAYSHLMQNYTDYQMKFPNKAKDITLLEIKAEDYLIKSSDNVFYFFNPFMVNIFEEVALNIEESVLEHPRVVDIILYYPGIAFGYYLDKYSPFKKIKTIKNKKYMLNNRECFEVYRYDPNDK